MFSSISRSHTTFQGNICIFKETYNLRTSTVTKKSRPWIRLEILKNIYQCKAQLLPQLCKFIRHKSTYTLIYWRHFKMGLHLFIYKWSKFNKHIKLDVEPTQKKKLILFTSGHKYKVFLQLFLFYQCFLLPFDILFRNGGGTTWILWLIYFRVLLKGLILIH
jgi:hypothetical protein